MELQEYLNILKKRWLLIVVVTLTAAILSGIISYFVIKPTYKADISVIIKGQQNTNTQTSSMNYNDVMMYQKLVKTYSEFTTSRKVMEHAINALGINMKPETLKGMISASSKGDTQFLTISVKSKDPKQAMDLANQLAKSLKVVSAEIQDSDNVQILDEAVLPTSPDSPRPLLNIAIAFLLGLMVSVGVVLLLEYLDNTIKTPSDVEKLLGIPVIGTIPFVTEANK